MDREGKRVAAGSGSKRASGRNSSTSKALAAAGESSAMKQQSSINGNLCSTIAAVDPAHGPNGNAVASSSIFCRFNNKNKRQHLEKPPVVEASTANDSNSNNNSNSFPQNCKRVEEESNSLPSHPLPPAQKQPSSSKLRLKIPKNLDEGIRVNPPLAIPRKARTAMVKKPQELPRISKANKQLVSSTQSEWSERELEVAQILCNLQRLMTPPASSPPPPGCLAPQALKSKHYPITSVIEDTSNDDGANETQQQFEEHHPSREDDQRIQPISESGLLLAPPPSYIVDEPPPSLVNNVTNPNPDTENLDTGEKKLMTAREKKLEIVPIDAYIAELETVISRLPGFNRSYQNEDVSVESKIPVDHQRVCRTDTDKISVCPVGCTLAQDSEQPEHTANLVNTDRSLERLSDAGDQKEFSTSVSMNGQQEKHSGDVGNIQIIAVEYPQGVGEQNAGMETLSLDREEIQMLNPEKISMKKRKMEAELPKQLSLEIVKVTEAKSKISKAERSGAASPSQIATASTSALIANDVNSLDPSISLGTVQRPTKLQPLGCHYSSAAVTVAAAAAACPEARDNDNVHMEDIQPSSVNVRPFMFPVVTENKTWKRCERHVHIAHFIRLQQQFQRRSTWAAAYNNAMACSNVSDLHRNSRNYKSAFTLLSGSSKERGQGSSHKGANLYTDTMPNKGFAEHPAQGDFTFGEAVSTPRETLASGAVCRSGGPGMIVDPGNNSGGISNPIISAATTSAAAAQLQYLQATIQQNTACFPSLSPPGQFRYPAHISPHLQAAQFYGGNRYKSIQQMYAHAAASPHSQQTESQSQSQIQEESNLLGHSAAPSLTVGLRGAGQSTTLQSTGDMATQLSQQQIPNLQSSYPHQQQQHLVDSQKPSPTRFHPSRASLESCSSYFSDCKREQDLPFHVNQSVAGSRQTIAGSQQSPPSIKFSRPAILRPATLGPSKGSMSMGSAKLLYASSVVKQKVSQQPQDLPASGHRHDFFSADSPASILAQQGSGVAVKSANRRKTKGKSSQSKKSSSSSSSFVSRLATMDSTLTNSAVVMGANYTTQGRPSHQAQNLQSSQPSQESSSSISTHQLYQQLPLDSSSAQSQSSLQMKQHNEFLQQQQQQQQPLSFQSQQFVQQQSSHSLLNGHRRALSPHHQQHTLKSVLSINNAACFSSSNIAFGSMRADGSESLAKSPGSPYVNGSGSHQISFGAQTVRNSQSNNAMAILQQQQDSSLCQLTSGPQMVNHQQEKQLSGCQHSNVEVSVLDCEMAGMTSERTFSSTTSPSYTNAHISMNGKVLCTPSSAAVMHEVGGAKEIGNNLLHHQAMVGSQ